MLVELRIVGMARFRDCGDETLNRKSEWGSDRIIGISQKPVELLLTIRHGG